MSDSPGGHWQPVEALGEIDVKRGRKGRQYALQSVLGISIAAILAGSNDLIAIFRWGRRLKPEALRLFGIERTRIIGGKTSIEVAYLITSLAAGEAGPERLLALNRAHWGIENKLHHVRDVSLNEDRCRVRAGARPLAGLRNLVTWMIRKTGIAIPEARENVRARAA